MMHSSKSSASSVAAPIPPVSSQNVSFAVPTAFFQPYNFTTPSLNPILYPSFFPNIPVSLLSSILSQSQSNQNSTIVQSQLKQPAPAVPLKSHSPSKPTTNFSANSKVESESGPRVAAIVPTPKPILTALTGSKIVQDKNSKFVKVSLNDRVSPSNALAALAVPEKPRKRKRSDLPAQDINKEKRVNPLIQHESKTRDPPSRIRNPITDNKLMTYDHEFVTPTTSPSTSPERDEVSPIFSIARPAVKPHKPHVNIRNVDRRRSDVSEGDHGRPARIGPAFQADIPELLQNLSQGRWSSDEEGDENMVKQEPDVRIQDAADCLLHLGDRLGAKPRPVGDNGQKVVRSVLVSRQDNLPEDTDTLGHDADVKVNSNSVSEHTKMEAECKPVKAETVSEDPKQKDQDLCLPEAVRGIRKQKQKLQYLIKWQGFKTLSWEPADSFSDDPAFQSLVESFKQRRANRSRTRSRRSRYPRARRADNNEEQQ